MNPVGAGRGRRDSRFYQLAISPLRPPSCRFTPSCSSYAIDAVAALRGPARRWLALRRLVRCHPWHAAGTTPCPRPLTAREPIPTTSPTCRRSWPLRST